MNSPSYESKSDESKKMTTFPWYSLATNQTLKKTEQFHAQEHSRHPESGTRLISRPVHDEEPTWMKLSLTFAGRSFAKMQTNGGMFHKSQGLADQGEEVEGEIGTDGNDIGRNVQFFET